MLENRGDIHHLFPKNYLTKHGVPQSMYNQIANYVFLQQEINIKISDEAPCIYMKKAFGQCQTKEPVYGGIVDEVELRKNLDRTVFLPDLKKWILRTIPISLKCARKTDGKKKFATTTSPFRR